MTKAKKKRAKPYADYSIAEHAAGERVLPRTQCMPVLVSIDSSFLRTVRGRERLARALRKAARTILRWGAR